MIIDRILLLVFFGVTLGGTIGIICSAPHVFDFIDQEEIIKKLMKKYKTAGLEETLLNMTHGS